MKRITLILVFVFCCILLNAQITLGLKGKDSKGKNIESIEFINDQPEGSVMFSWKAQYNFDGKREVSSISRLKNFKFQINNLTDFWQNQCIHREVYESLFKNGPQYGLRQDLEIEILNYLEKMENNNLFFEDNYLENYLYSLVYKIYPGTINDGRPGIINVKIELDPSPNAYICPNGTMIISTGLLSTINSEQELIGVISHEVSHFVLDHSIININKAIKRQKSAEFWAGFATVLAAAAEGYTASQNQYYVPGALTYSTAVLSFTIASQVSERLGLKYSRDQETEADICAIELMKFINVDSTSLSSALTKIKSYCILKGDYLALSGEGTHPNIDDRIKRIGNPKTFFSSTYDKMISFVNSQNAIYEFNSKHFKACQNLIDRNIAAGVPTEDDYILKAMTNLCLYDNVEKNTEALELINKAKSLNIAPTINLYKQEGLILTRLKKNQEAVKAFETYANSIKQEYLNLEQIKNEYSWAASKIYLDSQTEWTSKMIYKVKNL